MKFSSTTNLGVRLVTNVNKFYKVSFELNDSMNVEEQKAKLLKDFRYY